MSLPSDKDLLAEILSACRRIRLSRKSIFNDHRQAKKAEEAELEDLEIIEETAKKISKEFKKAHPNIPWFRLYELVFGIHFVYEGTDIDHNWEITLEDILKIEQEIQAIIENNPEI
jgi:uncharacterized protein with HEPN domain